jgi:hypothetical protein
VIYGTGALVSAQAWWLEKLGIYQKNRTPSKGAPNSIQTFPTANGQVVRVYGSDGRAVKDIDYEDARKFVEN